MTPALEHTVAARFPRLRGKRVLVAASGGADSTALALILKNLGCSLALAHVHHGLRGKSAAADARFVRALARRLDAPFFLSRFDVSADAARTGESLEMAARRLRRDDLLATARRERIRWVATGHTADDQAETVLMRVARGTGIGGLAGIPRAVRYGSVTVIRPLLDVPRERLVAFLRVRRQRWREDETNADDFALRNRVRHEVLPLIERRLNPAVRQALLRLADIAAAEDEVMSRLTGEARRNPGSAPLPVAIRRRLALDELIRRGTPPQDIDFAAIDRFPHHGKKFSMVWKKREKVFHGVEKTRENFPWCGKNAGKFSMVWKNGEKVFHGVENPDAAPRVSVRMGRGFSRESGEVCLSAAAVGGRDLVFRSWRAGDRMKPLGMSGSKKLSDIFTDLKVPRAERDAWGVVECGGRVAALAGWRVDRDFAVPSARSPSIRIRWD